MKINRERNLFMDWRKTNPAKEVILMNKNALMVYIAQRFTALGRSVQQKRKYFYVIFGGGQTPRALNSKLVQMPRQGGVDWARVIVFFSDERCVPPEHTDSNYGMIRDTLLRHLDIPKRNVYRIEGELSPDKAAQNYEYRLREVFGNNQIPSFDLALLGLGADGHTASLFPGRTILWEEKKLVAPAGRGPEGQERVTLTYPVFNRTRNVWFMISGKEKKPVSKWLLHGFFDPIRCPAQGVRPREGELVYIVTN